MNGPEKGAVTLHLTAITSAGQAVDHLVSDPAMTAGLLSDGWFVGLCGIRFAAAAMCSEPGHPCPRCGATLTALRTLPTVEERMSRRRKRARLGLLLASLRRVLPGRVALVSKGARL